MLRSHLLEQWYSLNDPAIEKALIKVSTMQRFAGIELINDRIPDETTVIKFCRMLVVHGLGEQIFENVEVHIAKWGMSMRQGTIVDATLIAADSSTKNKEAKRDPKMHQTKKENRFYLGIKSTLALTRALV
jgi:IS5 family transposase